jgi:CubicO group peptidase (beta-lactamase class C family)
LRNFAAAAAYSRQHNGEATLVLRNGEVVFESYYNGFREEDAHDLASGTKSFWGVAAVACEADGFLRLDDYVSNTINEWKRDVKRRRITIRQLLTLTSGLEPALTALDGPRIGNKYGYACALPAVAAPGSTFAYGASNAFVFGELLKRKLKRDPVAYLRTRILTPAGIKIGFWRRDRAGNSSMPAGCGMTARNWARFGRLVVSGGKLDGKTIVPAQKLKQCLQGSKVNPAYGLGFWLTAEDPFGAHAGQPNSFTAPADTFMAAGAGNQRLYIIPQRNLVIVHFGKPNGFRSDAFLSILLTGRSSGSGTTRDTTHAPRQD